MVKIYYESIGRNGNFLLNLPVDTRGLVHETDVARMMALKQQIDKDFEVDLAQGQKTSASEVRGSDMRYSANNTIDGNPDTYWATNDSTVQASVTISFDDPTEVNRILLQEYIPLGQRVKHFIIDAEIDGKWKEIDGQTTIGHRRILRFNTIKATKIRVNILDAKASPALSNIQLFRAPNFLTEPVVQRKKDGLVHLSVPDKKLELYYTLDGSGPTVDSNAYGAPFLVSTPCTLKVAAVDPDNGQSVVISKNLDISKKEWKVIRASSGNELETDRMIDEDPNTFWATDEKVSKPQEVVIDLGAVYDLSGFTYWPIQERYPYGIITNYEFSTSVDDKKWKITATGEFSNVVNSRIEQTVRFKPQKGRYIKIKGTKVDGTDFRASFGEIGVLTVPGKQHAQKK